MSNEVDDLIISLSIKPGSDLEDLKKSLDNLGDLDVSVDIDSSDSIKEIKRGLNDILFVVRKLRPAGIPTDKYSRRMHHGSILESIRTYGEQLIEPIMRTKELKTMMKSFGVSSPDEMRKQLMEYLKYWEELATEGYTAGSRMSPHSESQFFEFFGELEKLKDSPHLQRGKGLMKKFLDVIPEVHMQEMLLQALTRTGFAPLAEKQLFPLKGEYKGKEFIEPIQKAIGGRKLEEKEGYTFLTGAEKEMLEESKEIKKLRKEHGVKGSFFDAPKRIDISLEDLGEDFSENMQEALNELSDGLGDYINRILETSEKIKHISLELKTIIDQPAAEELIQREKVMGKAGKTLIIPIGMPGGLTIPGSTRLEKVGMEYFHIKPGTMAEGFEQISEKEIKKYRKQYEGAIKATSIKQIGDLVRGLGFDTKEIKELIKQLSGKVDDVNDSVSSIDMEGDDEGFAP